MPSNDHKKMKYFRLKEVAGEYNVSQKQICERTGIAQPRVSELWNNRITTISPRFDLVRKICIAFGWNAQEVVEPTDITARRSKKK